MSEHPLLAHRLPCQRSPPEPGSSTPRFLTFMVRGIPTKRRNAGQERRTLCPRLFRLAGRVLHSRFCWLHSEPLRRPGRHSRSRGTTIRRPPVLAASPPPTSTETVGWTSPRRI